ncbi:MAG: hypothetical protein ACI35W_03465 [Anaeroplasmataceae bacterium]
MLEKIKKNRDILVSLNSLVSQDNPKYYHFMASINALEINNDIIEDFIKKAEKELPSGECLTRIYGVLESLIKSVDALYSLCYIITNNKNIININQNRQMRELKYIRNTVINHPVSESFNEDNIGCCIIKRDKVTAKTFKYYIYYNKEIKAREIKLLDMIDAYYQESQSVLERIKAYKDVDFEEVISQLKKTYRKFTNDLDIREDILDLRGAYLRSSMIMANKDVRFIWRIECLMKFIGKTNKDKDVKEIYDYCIGYQLSRIYSTIVPIGYDNNKDALVNDRKIPKALTQFYKLTEKNQTLDGIIEYLYDMNHPFFVPTLKKCLDFVTEAGLDQAKKYFELIKSAFESNDPDSVYCLGVILNNQKK